MDDPTDITPGATTDADARAPGDVPSQPPETEEGRSRRRWPRVALALLTLLGTVGGLAALVLLVAREDETDTSPRRRSPERRVQAARVDAAVAELQRFVETERGLTFRRDVEVSLATDDEIRTLLVDQLEEERTELEQSQATLRALGLLEPQDDLFEMAASFVGSGVLGFYDPVEDRLVVRGQQLTPLVRATIAHELTHALQDQHFDLERPQLDDRDDESSLALTALAEGDAARVEDSYRESLSASDRSRADAEEERLSRAAVEALRTSQIPAGVLVMLLEAQALGPNAVQGILDAGGDGRLDEAFRSLPTTSEQLIDPERLLRGEPPLAVDPPAAGGRVLDHGVLGQYALQVVLQLSDDGTAIDPARSERAARAAQGWGGDRYVTWRARKDACIRVTWAMDTPGDLGELGDALDAWARPRPGARVDRSDTTITLTACDAVAGARLPASRLA